MKYIFRHIIVVVTLTISQWSIVNGQTLSPKVIPACGGYFSAGGKSLSWTMGETLNTVLTSGTKMLTQGNQQPYIFLKLLNLKIFIEGFYIGGGQMQAVLYQNNLDINPAACDSITVELHDASSPYSIFTSVNALLRVDGSADVRFPISVSCNSYYIAVRHRNSMEIWSRDPVRFSDAIAAFDFTSP
jgi:hypothetical protein